MKRSSVKGLKIFKEKSLKFKDQKIRLLWMKRVCLNSTPLKTAEMAQILTQNFSKGFSLPYGGVKINKDAFSRPLPKTCTIKGFQKMAILSLKDGLKGVLNTLKRVVKKIIDFAKKKKKSQPPIFRFLGFSHEVTRRITKKKEVIWQD